MVVDIEQVNRYVVVLVGKHSGYSQSIATIIARTSKNNYGHNIAPYLCDGSR